MGGGEVEDVTKKKKKKQKHSREQIALLESALDTKKERSWNFKQTS